MSGESAEKARDDHAHWASVCICGMSEQERTGHYPEHEDWCDVPSPLDDDAETDLDENVPTAMDALAIKQGRRTEAEARVCSQIDTTWTITYGDFVEQRVGCPGDGRYQPPGRGHLTGCQHDAVTWVWGSVEQRTRPAQTGPDQ